MAAASLVATALGIILILLTAYVIAAGILGLATSVAEAQKEMTALSIRTSGTSVRISDSTGSDPLNLVIRNTGSQMVDYTLMDVYLQYGSEIPEYFQYSLPPPPLKRWTKVSINPDLAYPGAWDPGENITISINTGGINYTWVQVTTPVGVSDSAYLPIAP